MLGWLAAFLWVWMVCRIVLRLLLYRECCFCCPLSICNAQQMMCYRAFVFRCVILLHAPKHECGCQPLYSVECEAGSIQILHESTLPHFISLYLLKYCCWGNL